MMLFIFLLIVVLLILNCVGIFLYCNNSKRRLSSRILKMIDDAIAGRFLDYNLDESSISVIENSMWRYIRDKEVHHQQLLKEKEILQEKISDISHQAVIPIANMILYTQLLEEWLGQSKNVDREAMPVEFQTISEQAEKLDFLIETLVKLSRLETGIIKLAVQKQKLQPVFTAIKSQFLSKADQKDIRLMIDETEAAAVFDKKWTIEVIANLVDNAIKYTPMGGTIAIDVECYPTLLRINISDNGFGISEMEQAKVFTRFYRGTSNREEPGVGIGLYLAREVMKSQNGYIKLTSTVGVGSTFSLFFIKEEMSQ
jgi:signal transduction histidine kinase